MSSNSFQGVPIAPGFIVGPLCVLARVSEYVHASNPSIEDPSVEVERFRRQVDALEEEIEDAINRLMADSFLGEAEILRAHLVMLKDPDLHDQVLGLIRDTCVLAESAVEQVLEKIAGILASAADPILAERATDFRDLGMRLTSRLSNQTLFDLGRLADDSQKAVLAVHELLPSLVLEARDHAVAGFIVESGTSLSHGAILAKSFSMPVVRLANLDSIRLYAGWPVLVACDGDILIDPTDAELRARRPKDDATVTVPCIPWLERRGRGYGQASWIPISWKQWIGPKLRVSGCTAARPCFCATEMTSRANASSSWLIAVCSSWPGPNRWCSVQSILARTSPSSTCDSGRRIIRTLG